MSSTGAIPLLIILFLGIALALPTEANIAIQVIESFDESLCSDELSENNVACKQTPLYVAIIRIMGILVIIVDLGLIVEQFRKGNIF